MNNYVPKKDATSLKNVISISGNGANTGATFYQSREFTVLQDAYAIQYKDCTLTDNQSLFMVALISKSISSTFEWTNKAGWEKVKKRCILLPIKNNEIDFDFMESFIAELEAQRIAELHAYLKVTGLSSYKLTQEEQQIIQNFDDIKWKEFNIIDLFKIKNTHSILKSQINPNSGKIPYVTASENNNSISSFISYDNSMLDNGNCVFIGGKTLVITYQKNDFFSNDSHNLALYFADKKNRTVENQLFFCSSLKSALSHKYTWGNSISNKKIKDDTLMLPINSNNDIDFELMKTLISAIQKLVIKDVVLYTNKKIKTTKQVLNKDDMN